MNAPANAPPDAATEATTEAATQAPQATEPTGAQFQPQGEPPNLADAADGAPAPAPAAPPAPAGRTALDDLASAVLDAAELANRGAKTAAGVSAELHRATDAVRASQALAQKHTSIAMACFAVVTLLALLFFVVTGVRMNSRINQLDATLLAVAKRAVALNEGLTSLEAVTVSVGKLAEQVDGLAKSTSEVGNRLDQSLKQTEALAQQIPAKTAEQVAASGKGLAQQFEGLNARLQSQSGAVQALGREMQSMKATVGNVDKLNREVQSLITLQRERYLEALQKSQPPPAAAAPAAAERERERNVQYPRPQSAVSPNAAPGGAIVVSPPRAN